MEIILYSTHCPRCTVLEAKLKAHNIQYTEVNDVDKMTVLGICSVPVLSVDNKLMNFTEALTWIKQQEVSN